MLSKLLKHEFRATGRIMLPLYGAIAALALLANLSIRFSAMTDNNVLLLLFGLIVAVFALSFVAAVILTGVMMVLRFYRNLLKEQGYLMHTLPVTVHGQVWSKLITSLAWFAATALVLFLMALLTGVVQSGTGLGELFDVIPRWAEVRQWLLDEGVRPMDLTLIGLELLGVLVLGCLQGCLHFYAAMSLGHMFSKDKIILSVVFYIAISFAFRLLTAALAGSPRVGSFFSSENQFYVVGYGALQSAEDWFAFVRNVFGYMLLTQLVQGALLYLATVLGLKRGLNLA